MERAKVINSGTRLIPDGFCFLDPLEELSILGTMLFHSMSVYRMIFWNEAGLVNFVCIVFEQCVKMLTLSSMENIIVECNLILSREHSLVCSFAVCIQRIRFNVSRRVSIFSHNTCFWNPLIAVCLLTLSRHCVFIEQQQHISWFQSITMTSSHHWSS